MLFIRKIDFISTKATLTFNSYGEFRYKTFFGGLMSLLSIIVSLIFTIIYLIDFINNENVTVRVSTETSDTLTYPLLNTIPFLFRLTNQWNKAYDYPERIYSIFLVYLNSTSTSNSTQYKIIPVEKCSLTNHIKDYSSLFSSLQNIDTYFCPQIRSSDYTVHGTFGSEHSYGYYQFVFTYCNNSTFKYNETGYYCYDKSYIEDVLDFTYLDFRFVDFDVNNADNAEIKTASIRAESFIFSYTMFKRIWMYVNNVKYIKDTGLFFKHLTENSFHQFNTIQFDRDLRNITDIDNTFASISIMGDSKSTVYYQRTMKLPELIADLSGIVKFIYMCCFIINYYYSYNSYYLGMINEMLEIITRNTRYVNRKSLSKHQSSNASQMSYIDDNLNAIYYRNNIFKFKQVNTVDKKSIKQNKSNDNKDIKATFMNSEIQLVKGNNNRNGNEKKYTNRISKWGFVYKLFPIWFALVSKGKKSLFEYLYRETNKRFSVRTVLEAWVVGERMRRGGCVDGASQLSNSPMKGTDVFSYPSFCTKKSIK